MKAMLLERVERCGRLSLALLLILTFPACTPNQKLTRTPTTGVVVIRAARMLDVSTGRIVKDALVVVEGERVTAAGTALAIPHGARVYDLGDVTLMPGLIDAHTHATYHFDKTGRFGLVWDASPDVTLEYAEENARAMLQAGITTARNLGASERVDLRLRDLINRGDVEGPRLLVSGEPLTASALLDAGAGSGARLKRIREFVRARIAEGADVIKIFEGVDETGSPLFSEQEVRAAVEEAASAGLRVAVHAHEAAAVKAAVKGGCASIEHGSFLDAEAVRLLAAHHTALVPTLYLPTHYLENKGRSSPSIHSRGRSSSGCARTISPTHCALSGAVSGSSQARTPWPDYMATTRANSNGSSRPDSRPPRLCARRRLTRRDCSDLKERLAR